MKTLRRACLACLSWFVVTDAPAHANPRPQVPAGFEDIALGQVEHLEVRLLGQSLGLFPVFVRPDDVRLETPEALAQTIDERMSITRGDTAAVSLASLVEALARPMPRNGHLACDDMSSGTGCRFLETESAGVILDESQGTLELFLSRAWLPAKSAHGPEFHANTPGSENALIHSQIVNAATTDRYRNLTVMGNGALGISPASYAGFSWSLVHSSYNRRHSDANAIPATSAPSSGGTQATLDSLYYRHDLGPRYYVQSGRMDQRNLSSAQGGSFGFTLLPVSRFDGARIGTSQAYVNESAASLGSPLTVLLTREARVDAYRGHELLGSAYFAAGVQPFDTRYFPEGSYLVSLRIFEGDTLVRTETVPYSKVGGGASAKGTQWFVQAGRVVDRLGYASDTAQQREGERERQRFTFQSGIRAAFGPGFTFTSGLVWLQSSLYNESQIGWQREFALGRLTTTAALLSGSDGARGNTQSISFSNGLGVSLYRYQMRDAACRGSAAAAGAVGANFGCYDVLNASVSAPLGKWQAVAAYSESQSFGQPRQWAGDGLEDPWLGADRAAGGVSRTLQTALSRSFRWDKLLINARVGGYHRRQAGMERRETGGFVSVSLSAHRPAAAGQSLSTYASAGADVRTGGGGERGASTDYHGTYSLVWEDASRRELMLSLNANEQGAGNAILRGAIDGRYGDAHAAVSRSLLRAGGAEGGGGGGQSSFVGGYASSFAVSRDGFRVGPAMLAGEPPAGVALVVDALDEDDPTGAAAATLQVGGRSLPVDFGASALSPVSGYRALKGEISEAHEGEIDHSVALVRGAGQYDYFLTPGRLKVHRVAAGRIYTYVGRAVGPDGLSMENARVLSVVAPPLDAQGTFLVESAQRLKHLYLLDGAQPMRCELNVTERQDVIHLTGVTQCDHVAQQAIPESLRAQLRVQRLLGEASSGPQQQAAMRDAQTGEN
ncbi:TcfC E-set like domain-containing protein [Pandoraea commovens]|uniref:Fimbrial protein n=1 Tax=Pandoraea commovens TaxID=2508289 RepID=A0A5E4V1A2_9BURK|nr:TcfC E-set like domain-containing protein [Pandoraea commovens]VVE04905.1 fimbrial protein [Pandoraea commovens]